MVEDVKFPPWPYNILYPKDTAVRVEKGIKENVPDVNIKVVEKPEEIIGLTGKPPAAGEVLVHIEIPQDKSLEVMTALAKTLKEPTV